MVQDCPPEVDYDGNDYKLIDKESRIRFWEEWQNEIDELLNYRQLEIYIFYSQIVAITMYVIYCKFMYNIMLYGKKSIHKNDPFFRILSNTNSDFLEK